jgi:hypothetical protein
LASSHINRQGRQGIQLASGKVARGTQSQGHGAHPKGATVTGVSPQPAAFDTDRHPVEQFLKERQYTCRADGIQEDAQKSVGNG